MSSGAGTTHRKTPSSIQQSSLGADSQGGEDKGVNRATSIGGPTDPNNKVIFVRGLSPIVNSDLLRQVFSQIGNVFHVHIPKGRPYGFVEYTDRSSAERAMSSSLNGSLLGGNKIQLRWAWGIYNHLKEWERKKPKTTEHTGHVFCHFCAYVQGYYGENLFEADDNNSTIYVGGLNSTVDDSALRLVFGKFGELVDIPTPSERYAFVEFAHRSCAERALSELDGLQLGGETARLNWSYRPGRPQQTRRNDATCSSTRGNLLEAEADESNRTIHIEGLDPTRNGDFYRSLFAQSGEIAHMELMLCYGVGHVRYTKRKHAETAVQMYNGLKLGPNSIRLSLAS